MNFQLYIVNCTFDLKPDDILCVSDKMTGYTILKLADIGLSKLLKPNSVGKFYTTFIKGTPIYMAKELVTAWISGTDAMYFSSADIFSLGNLYSD